VARQVALDLRVGQARQLAPRQRRQQPPADFHARFQRARPVLVDQLLLEVHAEAEVAAVGVRQALLADHAGQHACLRCPRIGAYSWLASAGWSSCV